MDLNNLDKHLSDQIKDYKVAIDTDALWADIESKQKKKKRRWFWIPFGFLFLAASVFLLTLFLSNEDRDTITENSSHSTEILSKTDAETEITIETKTNINNTKNSDTQTLENHDLATKPDFQINQNQFEIDEEHSSSEENVSQPAFTTNGVLTKEVSRETPFEFTNRYDVEKETNVHTMLSTANTFTTSLHHSVIPTEIQGITSTDNVNKSLKSSSAPSIPADKKQAPILITSFLKAPSLAFNLFDIEKRNIVNSYPLTQIIHVIKRKKSRISLLAYGGYGFASRSLAPEASATESHQALLLARTDTESVLEEFNVGLGIQIPITRSFYIRSGLEISGINEKLTTVRTQDSVMIFENIIAERIEQLDGSIEEISGNVEGTIPVTFTNHFYNTLRSFDIPLIAGYNITQGKWNLGLEGGVLVNTSFAYIGHTLGLQSDPAEGSSFETLDEGEHSFFRSSVGLKYTAGVKLSYQVCSSTSIFINPSYVKVGNVNNSEFNPIEQSYGIGRVSLGLSWRL